MLRGVRTGWLLAGLIAVSALVRYAAARDIDGLWIIPDESIYAALGKSLYETGRLAILDGPLAAYSLVYPALIGLPLALAGPETGHAILKVIQPAVMSLVAVPVYLWGRTMMPRGLALLAATLTLAVPGLLYSGLLMSHVAAYPVTALALWASARALERSTLVDQLLAVGAIGLAIATRLQALALVPALVTAILIKAALERKPRSILRFAPTGVALAAPVLLWLGWRLALGGHWSSGLGPYASAGTQSYSLDEIVRFVGYHLGAITLVTGVLPVFALALLVVHAATRREPSEAVRAYVAITVAYLVWEVAEVGAFASENAERLLERDIMTLAPPLFLGFAVWLSRGAPRTWLSASAVAIVTLVPLVTTPFSRLVGADALPDSFSIAPLLELQQRDPSRDLALIVSICAAGLAAVFVLVPRRFVAVLPALVLVWLVAASVASTREVTRAVEKDQQELLGDNRRWIDDLVDSEAGYLYGGEIYWTTVWHEIFWNEKLEHVFDLPYVKVPGPVPQTTLAPGPDGILRRPDGTAANGPRYLVATAEYTFVGTPVRAITQYNLDTRGLTLWRLDAPLRISTALKGVRANGDMHGPARIVVYDCRGGRLRVTLLPKTSSSVRVLRDGKLIKNLELAGEPSWSGTFPVPASSQPRTCTFELQPSGLLGSTVFLFER
jgi:hypothetical protein